jgi:hypothetical protein
MKKRQTFGDAYHGWVEAHRPHLFHPKKSWAKYLALKTAGFAVKSTFRATAFATRSIYHALTPEELPDARIEDTEALWHEIAGTPELDIPKIIDDVYATIPRPLSIHRKLLTDLLTPNLTPPPFDGNADPIGHAQWRDRARKFLRHYHYADLAKTVEPIINAFTLVDAHLPEPSNSPIRIPITDLIPNLAETIEQVIMGFFSPYVLEHDLYRDVRERLNTNATNEKGELIYPTKTKLDARKLVEQYFKDTPLQTLFNARVPFAISDETRFSHTWIVSTTGHGKTTFLSGLLKLDIERIRRGEISAVVIDSQQELIPHLKRLDVPKIIIDPYDIEHPIALSMFNIEYNEIKDPNIRNARLQGVILAVKFIIGALFDQEMTPRQGAIFDYITELLVTQKPDATIHDFRNLLDPQLRKEYRPLWNRADTAVKDFFETEFEKNNFAKEAAQQVLSRLRPLLRNRVFLNTFSAPKTKLHLAEELNKGRLVLIDTYKDVLTAPITKMVGRFWIGQISNVATKRQSMTKKLPTFVYIDEAQDYLQGGDPNIIEVLDQARKQRIGLTVIHHRTDQLESQSLERALEGNTHTQIVGGLTPSDMTRFGRIMRAPSEFFYSLQPRKTFGLYIKGRRAPFPVAFPNTVLSPELSEAQVIEEQRINREHYCYVPASEPPPQDKPSDPPQSPPDEPPRPRQKPR